ncbi:Uncharacterised protein [uncultured archaeon]|nr:Uncharacterised protein [uncultured archaeon]
MPKFKVEGDATKTCTVGKHGDVGAVYTPIAWVGREVVIILKKKKPGGETHDKETGTGPGR